MAYHVTITNPETNEVLVDCDTDAVVTVINYPDTIRACRNVSGCDLNDYLNLIVGMHKEAEKMFQTLPIVIRKKYRRGIRKELRKLR